MLGLNLTQRACEKIKMLDEYLTSCKADFWRSVRNRSKQDLVMFSGLFSLKCC